MTNLEKIQSMNAEELAKVLYGPITVCGYCVARKICQKLKMRNCQKAFKQWLEREVDEE